jgi:ABC-type glutathione transport system ATPase component
VNGLAVEVRVTLREFDLDVALQVDRGERVAVLGPSGAGKTTLLRAIAGLLRPAAGRIALGRETWFAADSRSFVEPHERNCPLVFADHALFPGMSAWRNVAYGIRAGRRRHTEAVAALRRFGIEHLEGATATTLSSGERQRVALARALAVRPRCLLFDEPLSALDASARRGALEIIRDALDSLAVPTLLVTHSLADALALADRLVVLERGRITQSGTAADLAGSPATPFVAELLSGGEQRLGDREVRGLVDVEEDPLRVSEPREPSASDKSRVEALHGAPHRLASLERGAETGKGAAGVAGAERLEAAAASGNEHGLRSVR